MPMPQAITLTEHESRGIVTVTHGTYGTLLRTERHMTPSKEHWQANTEPIARLILDAAAKSHSEEDLKMAVEPVLQSAMKQMGIDVSTVRYEK